MKYSSILLPAALVALVSLGGCGSSTQVSSRVTTTTMGQELQDLEESYKKGLLSESEYKKARKSILKRYQ
ncbi:hypothetical protein [Thiolapillus sp.]